MQMHIRNAHFHLGGGMAAAFIAAALESDKPAAPDQPAVAAYAPAVAPPKIGTYWTGQGGVYAGMGRGFDDMPDHHLIVPTDARAIFENRMLGTYGVDVSGASSDHNGMANTIALAAAGSELCKEALAVEIEGHKDFYLMSRTDARLCMANVPELFEKEWHLTSTQYSNYGAWSQNFGYGCQDTLGKGSKVRARLVRRLVL
jgi:hypothetical protein